MTTTENTTNGATPETGTPVISAAEVTDALADAVRKAVGTKIAAQARDIAAGVVERMLTPEVVEGMREAAEREVATTLDHNTSEAPTGPAGGPAGGEADEEEPERELEYETVAAFVDGYIAQLYRRETTAMGTERQRRWCPHWWLHGEAMARFEAMWLAFEHLRHGDGEEMSTLWLNHIDPHMAILLSPDGPFKYCTNEKGHSNRLVALPTVTAVASTAPNGNYEQAAAASTLWRPEGTPSRAKTVMAWPE
ncbi:DUF4913 domain-containing protein [Nocardia jinanensis]|uniref:DUF4913 domain-containing protein n=1 Tax=Nocardia jinanensis TaxID=382504 RepID=A0A917RZ33_9NOCA|nr:DUF4913 domain-containing protein [Nocardia jinanensis]GGL44241.1 hypothetical protein GCM10011588_68710 [Nocardia jinanensis]